MRVRAHPLDDQIKAVLRDAGGFPLSTLQVVQACGASRYSSQGVAVARRLAVLGAREEVERVPVASYRSVYWRG